MKAIKRRVLKIVDEIEDFKWYGSPEGDPDGIFYSIQSLLALAERLRAVAAMFPYHPLQSLLDSMDRELDGLDMAGGLRLQAQLEAAGALIRDAYEDFGDDVANWKLSCDRDIEVDDSDAAALRAQIDELSIENAKLREKLKDPTTRRLASYQRCVLVMAINEFGFRPNAKRQDAAVDIASASGSGSLKIGDDAVRSVLNDSVEDLAIDQTDVADLLAEVRTS